jgi:hypothetical protein
MMAMATLNFARSLGALATVDVFGFLAGFLVGIAGYLKLTGVRRRSSLNNQTSFTAETRRRGVVFLLRAKMEIRSSFDAGE